MGFGDPERGVVCLLNRISGVASLVAARPRSVRFWSVFGTQAPRFGKLPSGRSRPDVRRTAVVLVPNVHGYDMDASTDQRGRICHGLATLRIPSYTAVVSLLSLVPG